MFKTRFSFLMASSKSGSFDAHKLLKTLIMSIIITLILALSGLTSTDSFEDQTAPIDTPTEILTDEGGAG